jgi:O-antigen/teichoic acid export membrane protein
VSSAIIRNSLWSIVGNVGPLPVVIFTIPLIVRMYSTDYVGLIVIIWAILGYFGLLDLGLSRAMTYCIAAQSKDTSTQGFGNILGCGITLALTLGGFLGFVLAWSSDFLTLNILRYEGQLASEMAAALRFAAIFLPAILLSTTLRGALEGLNDFQHVSVVKLALGSILFAAPLFALPFGGSLPAIVLIIAGARLLSVVFYSRRLFSLLALKLGDLSITGSRSMELLRYGGWLSISYFIVPILAYSDRFFISNAFGPAEVAFYGLPHEVLLKSAVFPASIAVVLFPSFVQGTIKREHERVGMHYQSSLSVIATVMFLFSLGTMLLASPILSLWLGESFANRSALVVQILVIGTFASALMRVPLIHVQATGEPHRAAIIHAIELPVYLLLMLPVAVRYGIEGVAVAWAGRCVIEYWLLLQQSYSVSSTLLCSWRVLITTALLQPAMLTLVLVAYHNEVTLAWQILIVSLALSSLFITAQASDIGRLRRQLAPTSTS